jgi:hypothetical protein
LLTDQQITAIANAYLRERWGHDWTATRPFRLAEPSGICFWVARVDGAQFLDGPTPFFVFADKGRIVVFADASVQKSLLALREHPEYEGDSDLAYVLGEPDFTNSKYERLYSAFVHECLRASGAL